MEYFNDFFANLNSNVHYTMTSEKSISCWWTQKNQWKYYPIWSTISIKQSNYDWWNFSCHCNEILKCLFEINFKLLSKAFNQCLDTCTYPRNNSIITPLHKKECTTNPDNYKVDAVSSIIGKNLHRPDPINQLGFARGAHTYDHILTLNTIPSKYKRIKGTN